MGFLVMLVVLGVLVVLGMWLGGSGSRGLEVLEVLQVDGGDLRHGQTLHVNVLIAGVFVGVLVGGVVDEVLLTRKDLTAGNAPHATVYPVYPHVAAQVTRVFEGTPTKVTHVGALSGVDPPVYHQVSIGSKPLLAMLTLEWFLTRVCPDVDFQHFGACEPFVAVGADVRLLSGVSADVYNELTVLGEPLVAMRTLVRPLPSVYTHVCVAVTLGGETLAAEGTRKRPLSGVGLVVSVQTRPSIELAPTHVTPQLPALRRTLKQTRETL